MATASYTVMRLWRNLIWTLVYVTVFVVVVVFVMMQQSSVCLFKPCHQDNERNSIILQQRLQADEWEERGQQADYQQPQGEEDEEEEEEGGMDYNQQQWKDAGVENQHLQPVEGANEAANQNLQHVGGANEAAKQNLQPKDTVEENHRKTVPLVINENDPKDLDNLDKMHHKKQVKWNNSPKWGGGANHRNERAVRQMTVVPLTINESDPLVLGNPESNHHNFQVLRYKSHNILEASQLKFEHWSNNQCFYTASSSTKFSLKCIPRIFLIGFRKSGTTDLYTRMTKHQFILPASMKEPHWWDSHRKNDTVEHYALRYRRAAKIIEKFCKTSQANLSPKQEYNIRKYLESSKLINVTLLTSLTSVKCPFQMIDATPRTVMLIEKLSHENGSQFYDYIIPRKIKHLMPEAKVIVSMRNPVDRLFSDYKWFAKGKVSGETFHTLSEYAIGWWKRCRFHFKHTEKQCVIGLNLNPKMGKRGFESVLSLGIYHVYIQEWLKVFKREHIYFSKFEDFIEDPTGSLTQHIFPFLNISEISTSGQQQLENIESQKYNMKNKRRSMPANQSSTHSGIEMLEKTRLLLSDFYRSFGDQLAEMLQSQQFRW